MFDIPAAIEAASKLIDDGIKSAFPTEEDRANAQATLIKANSDAALSQLQLSMSSILAEAQSADKWTSRARPGFLYVIYIVILAAFPIGLGHMLFPVETSNFITGFKDWVASIPSDLWALFGAGYLGYTGARSFDKSRSTAK